MSAVSVDGEGRRVMTGLNRTKLAESVQAYFGIAVTALINGRPMILVAESIAALAPMYKKLAGEDLDATRVYKVGVTAEHHLRAAQWSSPNVPGS